MAALAALIFSLATLHLLVPAVRRTFTQPTIVEPMLRDTGFNPVNTALLVVLFIIGLGWFLALFRSYGERVDDRFGLAALVFALPAIGVRALEDADLFAPFREQIRVRDRSLPSETTCLPDAGLGQCADLFLVTPLIWIELALLGWLLFLPLWQAHRVGRAREPRQAVLYFAGVVIALWALLGALWAAQPGFIRFVPSPWIGAVAAIAAGGFVAWRTWRDRAFDWRWGLLGLGLFFGVLVGNYVRAWALDGRADWRASSSPSLWPLVVLVAAPVALAGLLRLQSPPGSQRPVLGFGRMLYLVVLDAAAIFMVCLWVVLMLDGRSPNPLWPTATMASLVLITFWVRRTVSVVIYQELLNKPVNLIVLLAHTVDGYLTSIAADVFGAPEKHVLARAMMELVSRVDPPGLLGAFPMATLFVPFKVATAFAFVVAIERLHQRGLIDHNLSILARLGIMAMGFGPAVRNALRLSLGI